MTIIRHNGRLFRGPSGRVRRDCCDTRCFQGEGFSLDTCKVPSDFYGEFPPDKFEDGVESGMCIRSLIWHRTRFDAGLGKILKTDTNEEVSQVNRDHCFRHTRWCGPPSLRSVANGAHYVDSDAPPRQRPFFCDCWDLTVNSPWPTSTGDFTYDQTEWAQHGCQTVDDALFAPAFLQITTYLETFGNQYDGWRVAILIVINTRRWMMLRKDFIGIPGGPPANAPKHNYPEIYGYDVILSAMVFHPESVEACLWDTETEDFELGCP